MSRPARRAVESSVPAADCTDGPMTRARMLHVYEEACLYAKQGRTAEAHLLFERVHAAAEALREHARARNHRADLDASELSAPGLLDAEISDAAEPADEFPNAAPPPSDPAVEAVRDRDAAHCLSVTEVAKGTPAARPLFGGDVQCEGPQFHQGGVQDGASTAAGRTNAQESRTRKVYALLAYCLGRRGQAVAARAACRRGLALFPDDAELRFRHGLLLRAAGKLEAAARALEGLVGQNAERRCIDAGWGALGFRARLHLAVVYAALGRPDEAEDLWRRVIAERPAWQAGWRGLGAVLLAQGAYAAVRAVTAQLLTNEALHAEGCFLEGRLALVSGEYARAFAAFEQAVRERPGERAYQVARCQVLMDYGVPLAARQALADLVARYPDDALGHHNLGRIYLRLDDPVGAVACLRRALDLRPAAAATRFYLNVALARAGQSADGEATGRDTLQGQPVQPSAPRRLSPATKAGYTQAGEDPVRPT